nr:30S ribosomal protein S27ae [Candidatus Njordarchaeum guaymaensis]
MTTEEAKKKTASAEPTKKPATEEAKKKPAGVEPAKKPPSAEPAKKPVAEEPAKKKKKSVRVTAYYKIQDGGGLQRKLKACPRCGPGTFLAEHYDRFSCGKCGYAEFKRAKEEKKGT